MKVDVVAIPRDYGFGMTIVVSVISATTGVPVLGLDKQHFRTAIIQGPSGWSVGDVLTITSGIFQPAEGVYAFSVGENSLGKAEKLKPGSYTLSVTVLGSLGRTTYRGQTLAAVVMK